MGSVQPGLRNMVTAADGLEVNLVTSHLFSHEFFFLGLLAEKAAKELRLCRGRTQTAQGNQPDGGAPDAAVPGHAAIMAAKGKK